MCYASPAMLRAPQLHPERKLRVPQHHPGHTRRGRGCCAISERAVVSSGTQKACPTRSPFALPSLLRTLSPTIPAHRRHSPVSPIIPALTQKQGGGGLQIKLGSSISLLVSVTALTSKLSAIVGAPTFSNLRTIGRSQKQPASEGGPYTNGASSTVNCKPAFLRPAFTMTSIAIVGAPTFSFLRAAIGNPKNRSEDRPLHERERRARCIVPLHGQPSQLNLDERRMRGRARGQRATGEHAGGGHAGAKEGLLAIGGRRAAHLAFH